MKNSEIKKALVIGGSGMLKETSLWLANQGYETTVLGRNPERIEILTKQEHKILPLVADYNDLANFQQELKNHIELHGKFDLIVAWIHHSEKKVLGIVDEQNNGNSYELYHIINHLPDAYMVRRDIAPENATNYYQIQLGFKEDNGKPRWLNNSEISKGVIQSIQGKQDVLVGLLGPIDDSLAY